MIDYHRKHRAQYLTIRELVEWEVSDDTGEYSGFMIFGEQIIGLQPPPPGFLPSANMTINLGAKDISAAKLRDLCSVVRGAFYDPHIGVRVTFGSPTIQ